jgi:hypothetical protein
VVGLAGLRRRLPRSKATPSGAAPVRLFRCERAVLARPAHAPTRQMCADASKCWRATCGTDGGRTQAWCKESKKEHARPLRARASAYVAASPASSRASTEPFIIAGDAARLYTRVVAPAGVLAAPSTAQQQHHPRVTGACIGGCLAIGCDLLGSSVVAAVYSFVGTRVLFGCLFWRAGRGSLAWHACSCAFSKPRAEVVPSQGPCPLSA